MQADINKHLNPESIESNNGHKRIQDATNDKSPIEKDTHDNSHDNTEISEGRNQNDTIHVRDVNFRDIFRHNLLASQFLRDYSGIELFAGIGPEDIEDQTERFRLMLGIEVESDTIKKVRVKIGEEQEDIYVISLLEHKSRVDYDIGMQLLVYMAIIWRDFAKEKNSENKDANKRKEFRYPLIIPIVYYEGRDTWTANMHLSDRIAHADLARDYIPDFTYKVIALKEYNEEELKKRNDEMSLIMIINKIQEREDFHTFRTTMKDYLEMIFRNTSEEVKNVIIDVIWGLLMRIKVPKDDAVKLVKEAKQGDMGVLFENLEVWDWQTEKEGREKAEARADKEKARADKEKARADKEKARADQLEAELKELRVSLGTVLNDNTN